MTERPNMVTPRHIAVAAISEQIEDVRDRIEAHRRNRRIDNMFHSDVIVFLEQVAFELRRAARHIEVVDARDDEGP